MRLAYNCGEELKIECRGAATTCEGKFHQLSDGYIGMGALKVNVLNENGFCGPSGNCVGFLHMEVNVRPSDAQMVPDMWASCAMAKFPRAQEESTLDWAWCSAKVMGANVSCDIPLHHVEAGVKPVRGFCVLTEGQWGKRLVKPTYVTMSNAHKNYMPPVQAVATVPAVKSAATRLCDKMLPALMLSLILLLFRPANF